MSITVFHAKHEHDPYQNTPEYDGFAGDVVWVPQGLNGSCGALQVTPSATEASAYKDIPANAEPYFNFGFHLARRTLAIPALASRKIAQLLRNSGAEEKLAVNLYYDGSTYGLYLSWTDDDDDATSTGVISFGEVWPGHIEIQLIRATGASAEDGAMLVHFDGTVVAFVPNLDIYTEFDFDRLKVGCMTTTVTYRGEFVIDEVRIAANDTGAFLIGAGGNGPAVPTILTQKGGEVGAEPLLIQGRSGDVWQVDLSNAGLPCVRSPKYASAGTARAHDAISMARCQLIDTTAASVWRVQVDDSTPHAPQLEAYDLGTTKIQSYDSLSIFSHNAREWSITVTSSGTLVFTAATSRWPVLKQPIVPITDEQGWVRLDITDAGSIFLTEVPNTYGTAQACTIRTQNHSGAFAISVYRSMGSLTVGVAGTTTLTAENIYYDFEVESAGGIVWRIQIPDENGTLTPWNVTAFEASRLGHTVAIDSRGKVVLIDPRFKTAHQRKSGWGGRTFRGGRA